MASTKIKFKMAFYVVVVLAVITFTLGFVGLGINIYGARFYIFGAIASFLMLVIVHSILQVMFSIIDGRDLALRNAAQAEQ
jgi:hypothetical protein